MRSQLARCLQWGRVSYRDALGFATGHHLPFYMLMEEVYTAVWPSFLYGSPLLLLVPEGRESVEEFERKCARQTLQVGGYSRVDDGLFGELGWRLRLWSRVQREALLLAATISLVPDDFVVRRVYRVALNEGEGTWAYAVKQVGDERNVRTIGDAFPGADTSTPAARRKLLKAYRNDVVSPRLLEQDVEAWRSRVTASAHLNWAFRYVDINPEPCLHEVDLPTEGYRRTDYVEWARLRAGAADFTESPSKRQARHFMHIVAGCPFGCKDHTDRPAEYLFKCIHAGRPRAEWDTEHQRFARNHAARSAEEKLAHVLTPPADIDRFLCNLRLVGWALRIRREAATRQSQDSDSDWSEADGDGLHPDI